MEKWQEAYGDYKKGVKYKEIAEKYGVSLGTVKSWASRKWKKKESEAVAEDAEMVATANREEEQPQTKRLQKSCMNPESPKRKPGAPKGNRNAVGNKGGAPKGSQNNYKFGIYEKILFDMLSDEEKNILANADKMDVLANLKREIEFKGISMERLFKRMLELQSQGGTLTLSGVISKKYTEKQPGQSLEKPSAYKEVVETNTISINDTILKFMAEINKLGNQRMKGYEILLKYELECKRMALEKKNSILQNDNATVVINIGEEILE